MGTLVTYRDLPGGPRKIKFADEISRHCLCRKCQMLSLCMYTDTASHMFCDNCLNDQSYKHKKYEIYCPDERKEVSLAEMFEARDLVTILRDQYVECPNQPKCTVKLPLGQLENHYIECKEISSIKCTKCGQEVPSTLWIEHKTNCQVTCDEFTLKESDNRGAKRKPAPVSSVSPPFSTSRKNKSTKSTTASASRLYPSSERADETTGEFNQQFTQKGHASTSTQPSVKPKFPTSAEPEKTTCKHCARKVKESNMPRHLEVCYEIPETCPYCEKKISKSDIKAHVQQCQREFETRKTSDATAASSEKLNKSKKTKAALPKRDENPPLPGTNSKAYKKQKKETPQTMRDGDSSHPGPYSNAQAAYSGSKTSITVEGTGTPGESSSHTGQEPQLSSGWSTDVDAWLPHATAGNWYAAYVAIEEQFKDTGTNQAARYAHFVPKLITLKLDHMVRDFIDAPYEPQPFDCLITALFARACLPLNVWPQGSKVTWDAILKYVPSVLHSRLSEDAKLYLRKHPVIPKDRMVDEVGIDAAGADMPGDTSSVTSSNRAITKTEASDEPEEDMRDLEEAQQQELDPLQALGKKEEAPDSEKAKKLSVAELLDDIASTLGAINIHEILSETGFRGEGGCQKTHDRTQQELSLKGTHERESDETDRSGSGLGSRLVSSEQKSNAAFQSASSPQHSGPSAAEPVESLAAMKGNSDRSEVKQPCRRTCAEAVTVPNPTPATTGAFHLDRDDGQESCHRKCGSYEYSESSSSKTQNCICEDKLAYSAVAQDIKTNPHSIPGHMGGGVHSCHQPNKDFSSEAADEDSKPTYVAGSSLPESINQEIPPTQFNIQREQIENHHTHALGSANTKCETSRGKSPQNARIFRNSSMKQKHGNNGVTDECRAGTTITAARYRSRNTVVSLSHPEPKEKSLGRTFHNSNIHLELENTVRQLRLKYFSKLLGADSGSHSFTHIHKPYNCEESDGHLMSEVSKRHCETGTNNGNHSQCTRKATQTSAISQAPKEEPAKIVKVAFSETDAAATAPDATRRKDDVDSTVLAPQFQASTCTPLETQVNARSKFQTNITSSLPLTCHGDTVADLPRIDTGRRISQELYLQTAMSSVDACSQTPEQAEQSVDDVSNNREKSFSDSFSSQETEV